MFFNELAYPEYLSLFFQLRVNKFYCAKASIAVATLTPILNNDNIGSEHPIITTTMTLATLAVYPHLNHKSQ